MSRFVTDRHGTVHLASRFKEFIRDEYSYVAQAEDEYGVDRRFFFDSAQIEALTRPAMLPCPVGYYVLSPYEDADGQVEGVVRTPVLGWTTTKEYPEYPAPLTLVGVRDEAAILCPDGHVVNFDVVHPTIEDYLDELRREAGSRKAA